ncbi:MAG: carbohydrate ABC transporter permease [Clostridia bacterium]|nr:carbohydrate ABC transporter permease [Clostridia bacterium]
MKRKMEASELIFKIIAYFFLIVFSIMCVYPLIYALSSSLSSLDAIDKGSVVLWPVGIQGLAFRHVLTDAKFWINYANTLFLTAIGTVWCLVYSILGAYALSKKRLLGRHGWNFLLVFTMWFSAGIVPQYINYQHTADVLSAIGIADLKWTVIIAMGMNATNIILLRNSFEGVPSEIEEAARIDGATELQILTKVYIPMSKSTIATVALFFGISRWNGYFWAKKVMDYKGQTYSWPIQVYIRWFIEEWTSLTRAASSRDDPYQEWIQNYGKDYSAISVLYAMVICAIIPILVIYPFIQKYFAKGVNMGGVKE